MVSHKIRCEASLVAKLGLLQERSHPLSPPIFDTLVYG